MINPGIFAELRTAVAPANAHLVRHYGSVNPYLRPFADSYCVQWSRLALPLARQALRPHGIDVMHVRYDPDEALTTPGEKLPDTSHEYLLAIQGTNIRDGVPIDGTWQQYRPEALRAQPCSPAVMVATQGHLQQFLEFHDVQAAQLPIWQPGQHTAGVHTISETPVPRMIRGITSE